MDWIVLLTPGSYHFNQDSLFGSQLCGIGDAARNAAASGRDVNIVLTVKLPNAEQAQVDVVKLRDYVLSQTHPRGRHKARVFLSALGLSDSHVDELRAALLESAKTCEAVAGTVDEFGARYTIDFEMIRSTRRAQVRGTWIIREGEDVPRLTSCYVL